MFRLEIQMESVDERIVCRIYIIISNNSYEHSNHRRHFSTAIKQFLGFINTPVTRLFVFIILYSNRDITN